MNKIVGWVPPSDFPPTSLKPYKYDEIGWNTNLAILSPPTPSPVVDTAPPYQVDFIQTQPDGVQETMVGMLERMQSKISSSEKTDTPYYINEDNTSIFLNAVTGMFFPSCHTHLEPLGNDLSVSDPKTFFIRNKERQDQLVKWQSSIYQRQVYFFNSILMIVLVVIFILVSAVPSFNYNTNVIDSSWFPICMSMMLLSGLISIVVTRCLSSQCDGDSSSADSDEPQSEDESLTYRRLSVSTVSCLLSFLLVLLPLLASLLLYAALPDSDPHLFLIKQENGGRSGVDLAIITAFPVQANMMARQSQHVRGKIEFDCYVGADSEFENKILIINSTKPKCKYLLQEDGFYLKAKEAKARAIILLDDTPKSNWRVSSPYGESFDPVFQSPATDLPFLIVRESDWRRFDSYFLWLERKNRDLILVWNDPSSLNLQQIFSCSDNQTVIIESDEGPGSVSDCMAGKHLSSLGSLTEKVCVSGQCSVFGQNCLGSRFKEFSDFSVDVECTSLTDLDVELVSAESGAVLSPDSLYSTSARTNTKYCCQHPTSNSTFLEVRIEICSVRNYFPFCLQISKYPMFHLFQSMYKVYSLVPCKTLDKKSILFT